jgi:Zn-finger nucleic acid-binding protein
VKCPKDGAALENRPYEDDVRVELCPRCRGLWLDAGELERIEDVRERDYREELARMADLGYSAYELALQKAGRVLRCPRCGAEMEKREYARCSQVMIDACPECHGVWLDAGELEALELFFERSRLEAGELRRGFLAGLRALFG